MADKHPDTVPHSMTYRRNVISRLMLERGLIQYPPEKMPVPYYGSPDGYFDFYKQCHEIPQPRGIMFANPPVYIHGRDYATMQFPLTTQELLELDQLQYIEQCRILSLSRQGRAKLSSTQEQSRKTTRAVIVRMAIWDYIQLLTNNNISNPELTPRVKATDKKAAELFNQSQARTHLMSVCATQAEYAIINWLVSNPKYPEQANAAQLIRNAIDVQFRIALPRMSALCDARKNRAEHLSYLASKAVESTNKQQPTAQQVQLYTVSREVFKKARAELIRWQSISNTDPEKLNFRYSPEHVATKLDRARYEHKRAKMQMGRVLRAMK